MITLTEKQAALDEVARIAKERHLEAKTARNIANYKAEKAQEAGELAYKVWETAQRHADFFRAICDEDTR